jgi:hypothetical protein
MKAHVKFFKALRALGFKKVWFYARYQAGLRSGYYRRMTPSVSDKFAGSPGLAPYEAYPRLTQAERDRALASAEEVCRGRVRLFGGEPVPLNLEIGASDEHWESLEKMPPEEDIKLIWEPARFGWALMLARGYAFSGDQAFAREFWGRTLHFLQVHPPYLGRQWQSAQEVAIRLMVLVFCDRVFATAPSSTPGNRARLWQAVAEHAVRIPPTMVYARAQNNNHLLSEAAGLFTAGAYLPSHPEADRWLKTGWRWLNWGFQHQISEFGTYTQHSVNYHRLMLQIALFTDHIRRDSGQPEWPQETRARLAAGTRWLWALTDPETGRAPNLGANDSAYLFPLSSQPWDDFRPVVNAAARAFLGQSVYEQNDLNEMGEWFKLAAPFQSTQPIPQAPDMLRLDSDQGRAFIRAAHFEDRPSHADQLYIDLWWRGVNIALDPGTYLYNAPPPWDNALQSSKVHNTLTVDGQEQMTQAGRFLWLDWAQAEVIAHTLDENGRLAWVSAEHDGYQHLGARHQRKLAQTEDGWLVTDTVFPTDKSDLKYHEVNLLWLLPDWHWSFESKGALRLDGPDFSLRLAIAGGEHLNLVRAGETLHGNIPAKPVWGWQSPSYSIQVPALQLIAVTIGRLPIELTSSWKIIDH